MRCVLFAVLLLSSTVLGAVPVDATQQPIIEFPPSVLPIPQPFPVASVPKLSTDQVYDVRCSVPCDVSAYPDGFVKVTKIVVPLGETYRDRRKFTDGADLHVYKGPLDVYQVEPLKTGQITLVVTPEGKKSSDIQRRLIDVESGVAPQPPPPIPPTPKPDPNKVDKAFVIVVENATEPRTVPVAQFLNDPFWKSLQTKHEYRFYLNDSVVSVKNNYTKLADEVGYPAVLVLDAATGKVLRKFKSSGTVTEVDTAVKEVAK